MRPSAALILVAFAAAVPIRAETLVVLNKAEASASLIDLATGKEAARIPTGVGPHEAATAPDGRRVLVANYGATEPGSSLTLIDAVEARVLKTIDLQPHTRPHGLQWIDATRAAVTTEGSRSLLIVNVETGAVERAIATGQDVSHMVALTPDRARAFVANIGSGSVTVVDLASGSVLRQIASGAGAEGLDVTPDGRRVFVTNRAGDTITVLDAVSLETLGSAASKAFPIRARVTPDGRRVLVSNARSGDVAVFDVATLQELKRIPMAETAGETEGRLFGGQFGSSPVPVGIVVHPNGRRAYVANTNADVVSVIDLEKGEVVGRLRAGKEPDGMAFVPSARTP